MEKLAESLNDVKVSEKSEPEASQSRIHSSNVEQNERVLPRQETVSEVFTDDPASHNDVHANENKSKNSGLVSVYLLQCR